MAEMAVVENKEWILSGYVPEGIPTSDHLKLRKRMLYLDEIPDQHVALHHLWISIDPYLRSRMTGRHDGLYSPQFPLNQVPVGFAVGRVIRSKNNDYKEGDIVINPFSQIAEYCVAPPHFLTKVDPSDAIPLPHYLTSLGVPGFTAWLGIDLLGDPKPGCNVFISAAAGGVGLIAGQLAKLKGCRVIGSTGSDDKVKLLKEEFGYDDAFNYHKEKDLDAALAKYFPDGIDIYLDNVGGRMLEAVLNHVNTGARIPISGMISQYNTIWTEREGVRNLLNIVGKQVRMQGFLCHSYVDRMPEFSAQVKGYIREGKIKSKNKIYHGIESFLESLDSLFTSSNVGKVVIQVTP